MDGSVLVWRFLRRVSNVAFNSASGFLTSLSLDSKKTPEFSSFCLRSLCFKSFISVRKFLSAFSMGRTSLAVSFDFSELSKSFIVSVTLPKFLRVGLFFTRFSSTLSDAGLLALCFKISPITDFRSFPCVSNSNSCVVALPST